jgi:hypothetical protein
MATEAMATEFAVRLPIATLGPAGTDAEHLARRLSCVVILHDTFRSALRQACAEDCVALVACGCMSAAETWPDLHFQFNGSLAVVLVASCATKPMCFATNGQAAQHVRSIGVYPALRSLAQTYAPGADVVAFESKPAAVQACAEGRVDACIGSLDVVRAHGRLSVVDIVEATMVWTLYARCELDWQQGEPRRSWT